MTTEELLRRYAEGERDFSGADLSSANLCRANLCRAYLSGADLSSANLSGADLYRADLSGADLSSAYLYGAYLSSANLSSADLSSADLSRANLSSADLSSADLSRANLSSADLSGADLSGADLYRANLSSADLSRAIGLPAQVEQMDALFERDERGWIVYKVFNLYYRPPGHWTTEPGSTLTETCDMDRRKDCAPGVNVLPCGNGLSNTAKANPRKARIPFDAEFCVPYGTDGKVRAATVELIGIEQ